MKASHDGPGGGNTVIHCNPMIQKPSSDYYSIYLTMSFVSDVARKCGYDPVLTFGQPLESDGDYNKQTTKNSPYAWYISCMHKFNWLYHGWLWSIFTGDNDAMLLELMSYDEHTVPHILSDKGFPGATRANQITSCFVIFITQ